MCVDQSLNAREELRERFDQAKKDFVIAKDAAFKIINRAKGTGEREMYCLDRRGNKLKPVGTITFSSNV